MKKSFLIIILLVSITLSAIVGAECKGFNVSVEVVDNKPVTGMSVNEPAENLSGFFEKGITYIDENIAKIIALLAILILAIILIKFLLNKQKAK